MKNWKILSIVVVVSILGFGLIPFNKSINKLKIQNTELTTKKEQKIAESEELKVETKNEDGEMIDPELRIPRKLEQTELLIDLQKIASETGIQLPDSWSFSINEETDLELSKLGVSFPIKGSRGDIYKFLKLLEKNERILEVKQLSVRTFYEESILISEMMINLQAFSQEKIK